MIKTAYDEAIPYITKDGTTIRELMHPQVHGNDRQSLAEAILMPGVGSILHRHLDSEELYHVLAGRGILTLGEETAAVAAGDTVCIPPGTPHRIRNTGSAPLRFLCCTAPPYTHEQTQLIGSDEHL